MKFSVRAVTVETFISEIHPEFTSEHSSDAEVLAWADANPVAWGIVTSSKSKVFGVGSSDYLGCYQTSKTPSAVLHRLHAFRNFVLALDPLYAIREAGGADNIFEWRARFTLAHFEKKGFTGGLFQQHATWTDKKSYPRACLRLDYTPETLEEVLDRFCVWMHAGYRHENTTHVTIDGREVRRFPSEPAAGEASL